ncbi:MAG: carboxypeptidase-like regulatory domain-containing protein [Bacteroidales bacterium]|nr:carboxypeptidase-like regulatory domain-containing protein [Bacteroidales bacterium]
MILKKVYEPWPIIKTISILIFSQLLITKVLSQNTVSGLVQNKQNTPVFLANIIFTDSIDKVIKTTITDNSGCFIFQNVGEGSYIITISNIGYKKKIKPIYVNSDIDLLITLDDTIVSLDEVIVHAEKPISIRNDTISFNVKYFVNGTEQTVEDLLEKIPGINVDDEGAIRIGDQEIEKLMIDGDDLFEKGYKILSKNMPAYPIDEVEIINKYSSNHLLKGIENSDKVALNLKLNDQSKNIWFGNLDVNVGNDYFYLFKGNLMNFGKRNKYYFFTNLNNIGYDAHGDIEHLIHPARINESAQIGDNQQAFPVIELFTYYPGFKRSRINFNNARLLSLNSIYSPTEKLKIKPLIFINWDNNEYFRSSVTKFDVGETEFTNTEDYLLRKKQTYTFAKLDIIHNKNNKLLESVTKYSSGEFYDESDLIFNSNSTIEDLRYQTTLIDQKINYTYKLKNKKVLLLTGRFINEKFPQKYSFNQFFFKDLFPEFDYSDNVKQIYANQMSFAGIDGHFILKTKKNDLLEIQTGNEYRKDLLFSDFFLLKGDSVLNHPDNYKNQTQYKVNDFYIKGKYSRNIGRWCSIINKVEFHHLYNMLGNNNTFKKQNLIFVNPSFGLDWQLNKRNKITSAYNFNTTNTKVIDIYDNYILTGYNSFTKGLGDFNQLNSSNIVLNYQLGNWNDRFFANTFALYSRSNEFFSTNTYIIQNYAQSEKIIIKDRKLLNLNLKIDYYFKFISSNGKFDLGYTKSEYKNIVNDTELRTVLTQTYNYGMEFRTGFRSFFNFHIGSKWTNSIVKTSLTNTFKKNLSFLDLFFIINDNFNIQLQSERYYFGKQQSVNSFYFLDFTGQYKLIKNKLNIGFTGKNLFNTEKCIDIAVSDISLMITEYMLLPRCILLRIEYRF